MPPKSSPIQSSTLSFLSALAKHNDRLWFQDHKQQYVEALSNVQGFADALIERMNRHDRIATSNGKEALFRIYNDQRFHKDKPPYKTWFAGGLDRIKPTLRGGYYFHIEPGNSFLGCGYWAPDKEDLKRIRMDLLYDHGTWEKLLNSAALRNVWGQLEGRQLKTVPRGFPKDHPAIGLLRYNQFIFRHTFTDKEVLAQNFVEEVNKRFKAIRPWFNHLSEVLTTDENGNPLIPS